MAKIIPIKSVAWSFSALNSFQTCGRQYHEVKVLKRYQDGGETDLWGKRVHAYFAHQLLNKPTPYDPALTMYDAAVQKLQKIKGVLQTEQQLAITNAFKPTSWFASDVWCRAIADAMWLNQTLGTAIDLKTGRRKQGSKQLLILALLMFATFEELEKINTGFVWLQTGAVDIEKYKREDVSVLWQEVLPDVRRFEMAHQKQQWVPKPSGLCKGYCPVIDCSFNEGFKEHGVVV